jgi:hypothetical protein
MASIDDSIHKVQELSDLACEFFGYEDWEFACPCAPDLKVEANSPYSVTGMSSRGLKRGSPPTRLRGTWKVKGLRRKQGQCYVTIQTSHVMDRIEISEPWIPLEFESMTKILDSEQIYLLCSAFTEHLTEKRHMQGFLTNPVSEFAGKSGYTSIEIVNRLDESLFQKPATLTLPSTMVVHEKRDAAYKKGALAKGDQVLVNGIKFGKGKGADKLIINCTEGDKTFEIAERLNESIAPQASMELCAWMAACIDRVFGGSVAVAIDPNELPEEFGAFA